MRRGWSKAVSLWNTPWAVGAAAAVGVAAQVAAIGPLSAFIRLSSTSVVRNFYGTSAFLALTALVAALEMQLVSLLWWGRERRDGDADADGADPFDAARRLRATGTKKSFVFVVVAALNLVAFDVAGRGVLLSATRRYSVMTRLRSTDAAVRESGAKDAVQLPGDAQVAAALVRVLDHPGPARHWAAWAAGIRRDQGALASLHRLLDSGTDVERAAAAVALARLEDTSFVERILAAWPHAGRYKVDFLIALGMVGKKRDRSGEPVLPPVSLRRAGQFLTALLEKGELDARTARVAMWALKRFESPEGLDYLEGLLSPETDVQTLCVALEALGNIGAADSSPKMIALIDRVPKDAACREEVAADFAGGQVLVAGNANLIARIIAEVARIGDIRAVGPMRRLSQNPAFPKAIRDLAAEFVYRKQFAPAAP